MDNKLCKCGHKEKFHIESKWCYFNYNCECLRFKEVKNEK